MKKILLPTLIASMILAACTSSPTPQTVYSEPPQSGATPTLPAPAPGTSTATTITINDNGRTVKLKAGDTFLLNLGSDIYDWEVSIDHQDVLHLKMGILVIQGAQGLYEGLSPGTATLSASGNPHCLNSKPACMMPSILFSITVIVQ